MKVDVETKELDQKISAAEKGCVKKYETKDATFGYDDEFVSPLAVTWFNFRMNQVMLKNIIL